MLSFLRQFADRTDSSNSSTLRRRLRLKASWFSLISALLAVQHHSNPTAKHQPQQHTNPLKASFHSIRGRHAQTRIRSNPREVRMSVQPKIMTSFQCYFSHIIIRLLRIICTCLSDRQIPIHVLRPFSRFSPFRFWFGRFSIFTFPSHHIFAITAIGAHKTIAVVVWDFFSTFYQFLLQPLFVSNIPKKN